MILPVFIIEIFPPLTLLIAVFGLWWNPSKWRTYLPMLVYVLFIGAYCYIPDESSNVDLIRYLPEIEYYNNLSLKEALTINNDILFTRDILFWICGKLQIPHMVPAFTTAAVYMIAGYMTCDCAERHNKKQLIPVLLLFQLMMLPYISIVNNVRNVFGLSVIALAAYRDIIKNNRNIITIFLYAAGTLMHLSCFVLIVFRILCKYSEKFFEAVLIIPFIFSTLIYAVYEYSYIFSVAGALGNTIQTIIRKMYRYLENTTSDYALKATSSRSYLMNRMIMMTGAALILILVYYGIRYNKKLFKDDSRMHSFVGMTAAMTLGCNVFAIPNYWRFAAAMYVMSGVVFVPLLNEYRHLPVWVKLTTFFSLLLGPLGLFIQWYSTRNIAFFDMEQIILTNNITILFQIIKGIFS